jgi:hypothetical protein
MTAWHGGKGSSSRPKQVSNEDYANRWDAIFGRSPKDEESPKDWDKPEEEPIGKPLKEEPLKEHDND